MLLVADPAAIIGLAPAPEKRKKLNGRNESCSPAARLRRVHSRREKYSFPIIFRLADDRFHRVPVIAVSMAEA
jgi:hypothetical protein